MNRTIAVALSWLSLSWLSLAACARGAGPSLLAAPQPQLAVPPAPSLSLPAPAPLPPAPPPPEVTRLDPPPWLTLEAVHGTSHDIHHPGMIDAAFSDDGRTLVTLARDGELRVWDLPARALRAQRHACEVKAPREPFWKAARKLALSPDGLAAVGFTGGRVCVLELDSDLHVRDIAAHDAHIVALAFRGGQLVSYGYQEQQLAETSIRVIVEQREGGGQARWWDPRTGAQLHEIVLGRDETVALSPDGAWLATGRTRFDRGAGKPGQAVGLWRRDGRAVSPIPEPADHVAVTRAGDVLYIAEDKPLRIWSRQAGVVAAPFETANGTPAPSRCVALAVTDDGRFAATLVENGALLVLWDIRARHEISRRLMPGKAGSPWSALGVAFSADGSMLATFGGDDAWVWATRDLSPLVPVEGGVLANGELERDGRHLLNRRGKVARLLDITTGQAVWQCPVRDDAGLRLLPGARRFLETHYGHTAVRDVATCGTVWEAGHETWGPQTPLLISPDGKRIALNDRETGGPRMHATADGRVLWQGKLGNMLAFSPDSRTLYVETRDWHILALAATDGAVQSTIDRERSSSHGMYLTPDGRRAIIHGYQDGAATTFAYDLTTGKRLWQIKGTDYRLFLLPDSQTFVSDYTTIRLRSLATGLDIAPAFYPGDLSVGTRSLVLPDGKTLLLATADGLVLRYRIDVPAR